MISPLYVLLFFALKHYGISLFQQSGIVAAEQYSANSNDFCANSQNHSTNNIDRGTINVNFTANLAGTSPSSPIQCSFTIRMNQSALLFWYDIAQEFDGNQRNCSESKNIIKVFIGCYSPRIYCLTNRAQKEDELYSADGCFQVQLTTHIRKGFVFNAGYGSNMLRNDFVPYNDDSSQFFSNYLVAIIIGPVVLLTAVIGITFAMMRQAQHRRMVDTLHLQQQHLQNQQEEQSLISSYQHQASTISSETQEPDPSSSLLISSSNASSLNSTNIYQQYQHNQRHSVGSYDLNSKKQQKGRNSKSNQQQQQQQQRNTRRCNSYNPNKRASQFSNRSMIAATTSNDAYHSLMRTQSVDDEATTQQQNKQHQLCHDSKYGGGVVVLHHHNNNNNNTPDNADIDKPPKNSDKVQTSEKLQDLISLNEDRVINQQQEEQVTNFIENPLSILISSEDVDEHSPNLRSPSSPLVTINKNASRNSSRYSRRLSSIDSLFDKNLLVDCVKGQDDYGEFSGENNDHQQPQRNSIDEQQQQQQHQQQPSTLIRTDSSDSYFDKM